MKNIGLIHHVHHLEVAPAIDVALHEIKPIDGATKPAVLFLHGAMENGKIFFSKSGKGLALFGSTGVSCLGG
jgi:hypothetical protein